MRQQYTKVKGLIKTIRERKSNGETNREIAASLGLTLKQVKQLINREQSTSLLINDFVTLCSITFPAQCLEVIFYCPTALCYRNDVVYLK